MAHPMPIYQCGIGGRVYLIIPSGVKRSQGISILSVVEELALSLPKGI
jgi:hypothetical protein